VEDCSQTPDPLKHGQKNTGKRYDLSHIPVGSVDRGSPFTSLGDLRRSPALTSTMTLNCKGSFQRRYTVEPSLADLPSRMILHKTAEEDLVTSILHVLKECLDWHGSTLTLLRHRCEHLESIIASEQLEVSLTGANIATTVTLYFDHRRGATSGLVARSEREYRVLHQGVPAPPPACVETVLRRYGQVEATPYRRRWHFWKTSRTR
jgi:hypothetical protein